MSDNKMTVTRLILTLSIVLALTGCETSPERQQAETIAKRNSIEHANNDAVTIKMDPKKVKPPKPQKVQKIDSREAQYFAGKKSKIYHCRGCQYVGKLDSPVGFSSCEDAERAGHIACEFCKPRENGVLESTPTLADPQ